MAHDKCSMHLQRWTATRRHRSAVATQVPAQIHTSNRARTQRNYTSTSKRNLCSQLNKP